MKKKIDEKFFDGKTVDLKGDNVFNAKNCKFVFELDGINLSFWQRVKWFLFGKI